MPVPWAGPRRSGQMQDCFSSRVLKIIKYF
jgi:hypothetical protein